MKHSYYRKSMRILSIVLLITTMITSGAFAMYASELPVIVNELIASSQQQSTTVFSEPRLIPDDTFALLQRMSEYDTFTEEEKIRFMIFWVMPTIVKLLKKQKKIRSCTV